MTNITPLHFVYKSKGKNICVLMLLCVPLSMMDIPGPCKHAVTMDHLLQLKQMITNQLRTSCSITYTFIERKHLSVACYVKATLPRVLELLNVHIRYVPGSDSSLAVVSIQNLILNIYSQHCIPSLNEELEENPVAFERQYKESPVRALLRVEEVLSLYLHLITTTNTTLNWTCGQEYSSVMHDYSSIMPPTVSKPTSSTEAAVGLSRQAPQGSLSDDFYRLGFIVVSICAGLFILLTVFCLLKRKNTKEDILKKVGNRTALAPIHFYCMDTKPMQKLQHQLHRARLSSDWGLQVVENFEIQEQECQMSELQKRSTSPPASNRADASFWIP